MTTNESENIVDELLIRLAQIEAICDRYSGDKSETKADDARQYLSSTQTLIDNNRSSIPSYSLKKITEVMKKLDDCINEPTKTKLSFKFKPQSQTIERKEPGIIEDAKQAPEEIEKAIKEDPETVEQNFPEFLGFKSLNDNCDLELGNLVDSKDVKLIDLKRCQVRIFGLASTVYVNNLEDCKVTICLVRRSISINNCKNCQFKLAYQQLRINTAFDCTFEIFSAARSMLESSKGLIFKQLNLNSLDLPQEKVSRLFREASFNMEQNNYKNIDDFDWLVPNMQSENYECQ